MTHITPHEVANILPLKKGDIVFVLQANLDASFPSTTLRDVCTLSVDEQPQQFTFKSDKTYKSSDDVQYSVGVNAWIDNSSGDIYYQAFFINGPVPIQANLPPPSDKWKAISSVEVYDPNVMNPPSTATAIVDPPGVFLSITVQPVYLTIDLRKMDLVIEEPEEVAPKTSTLLNREYTVGPNAPEITWKLEDEYTETHTCESTITDEHHLHIGFKAQYKQSFKVGFLGSGGKSSIALQFELDYDYTRTEETKNTWSNSSTKKVSVDLTVQPGETLHYLVLGKEYDNVKGNYKMRIEVKGTMFGAALGASFIESMLRSKYSTIELGTEDDGSIFYLVSGTYEAKTINHVQTFVTQSESIVYDNETIDLNTLPPVSNGSD